MTGTCPEGPHLVIDCATAIGSQPGTPADAFVEHLGGELSRVFVVSESGWVTVSNTLLVEPWEKVPRGPGRRAELERRDAIEDERMRLLARPPLDESRQEDVAALAAVRLRSAARSKSPHLTASDTV